MASDELTKLACISDEIARSNGIDMRIDGMTYAELVRRLDDDRTAVQATKAMLLELLSNVPGATTHSSHLQSWNTAGDVLDRQCRAI